MENLTNITILRARPGLSEALGLALERLVEPCRAAAGCLQYRVHRSEDEAGVWCIYEMWRSRADLRKNLHQASMDGFFNLLRDLAEPQFDLLTFSDAEPLAAANDVAPAHRRRGALYAPR